MIIKKFENRNKDLNHGPKKQKVRTKIINNKKHGRIERIGDCRKSVNTTAESATEKNHENKKQMIK